MKLSDKYQHSRIWKTAAAAGLNALFLCCALLFIAPHFEANDDLTLAAFADGQMAVKCGYIPYINFVLAQMLKGIYTVLGESVTWHSVGQYILLFLGFTGISRILAEKLRFRQSSLISIIMLLFFGVDCYMIISYTKTAAVCAVGGMCLIYLASDNSDRTFRILPAVMGILLCLFGFMLRKMEFLPCMAITAVLCLRWLYKLLFAEKELTGREKLRRFLSFAAPFALMLVLCGGLLCADKLAWSRGRWGEYASFDAVRVDYSDYGRPAYALMAEEYDSLGLTESAVQLLEEGNYFDPDNFTKETMAAISAARDARFPRPSVGECLGVLLDDCIPGFFVNLHVFAFLALLVLWLAAGEHDLCGMLTLAGAVGLFCLFYMYLIYRGRYLIDRVDVGLFLAMFAVLSMTIRSDRLDGEKLTAVIVLALSLYFSHWMERDMYRSAEYADLSRERAAVERILSDDEHIYLAKLDTVNDTLYPPFTPAPAGYWDRIILLGGWDCNHPALMDTLARYGVRNPYRDAVGNDKVYFIEDNIDLTLQYIHDYYDSDASAELVEPLSRETGLSVYRILD